MSKLHLCIHGHFYQPPRENPWIEEIEIQESAAPFHDWNERIYLECYAPNAMARILDGHGKIVDIINNFEKISFNFGPTLLSWLEEQHPITYKRILEADVKSAKAHGGHGNAIAQVYNHIILPLANERDKETQIIWGIEDFKFRFGREPEALWLSETACNQATLEVLIQQGMRFVILEPHQAEAVRSLEEEDGSWQDVSNGQIDPKQPYRCFLESDPTKYIDIFFFDGPISKAVSFDDLLQDAKKWMKHVENAASKDQKHNQLVHMATDGETYGHHKMFGDRVLAYLLNIESVQNGFQITNYGEYLEKNPPTAEVKIKAGDNGEGTSWSCSEGVKRWKDHTDDCAGMGQHGWNQNWRKPLRESLDWLRDMVVAIYEEKASVYLKDAWTARNDYIQVILNRSPEQIAIFMQNHQRHDLTDQEITYCLKLLEMQRQAMLMYTSCGWFFEELSRIETTQILTYACRVMELAFDVSGIVFEEEFLSRFMKAQSNLPQFEDGRDVYERLVKSQRISWRHIVNYYAIVTTLNQEDFEQTGRLYAYDYHVSHQRKDSFGAMTVNFGVITLSSRITLETKSFVFLTVQVGVYDFRTSVKSYSKDDDLEPLEKEFFEEFKSLHVVEVIRRVDAVFGTQYYAIKDLPREPRLQVISLLTKEVSQKINHAHEELYEESRRVKEIYESVNLPMPSEIRDASIYTLRRKLEKELMKVERKGFNAKNMGSLDFLIQEAQRYQVEWQKTPVRRILREILEKRISLLGENISEELLSECFLVLKMAKKMNLNLDIRNAQDTIFFLLKSWNQTAVENLMAHKESVRTLLDQLGISSHILDNLVKVPQA